MLAVGDGASGFWGALREVFPATRNQRCWVHKLANVLNALPTSAQPTARRTLAEVRDAEDRDRAVQAIAAFARDLAKWPKAVAKVVDDAESLLAFFDFPAEHWVHLKTTNPIESTFATVHRRTRVTKGPGSLVAGLAMAFKLTESAQPRWREVNSLHLVALVWAGATFEKKGVLTDPGQPARSGSRRVISQRTDPQLLSISRYAEAVSVDDAATDAWRRSTRRRLEAST